MIGTTTLVPRTNLATYLIAYCLILMTKMIIQASTRHLALTPSHDERFFVFLVMAAAVGTQIGVQRIRPRMARLMVLRRDGRLSPCASALSLLSDHSVMFLLVLRMMLLLLWSIWIARSRGLIVLSTLCLLKLRLAVPGLLLLMLMLAFPLSAIHRHVTLPSIP